MRILTTSKVLAGAAWVAMAGACVADELPAFRKGVWEFNRTVESSPGKTQTLTRKECTSPSDDMKKSKAAGLKGCTFSPVTSSGNSYSFTTTCNLQGATMMSKSVITAESDSAYKIKVETRYGDRIGNELLVARRTGDC